MENTTFRAVFFATIGVFLGSFGSVMISRFSQFTLEDIWERKKDFVVVLREFLVGRSVCDMCTHTL
jgi:hypothetical protein